MKHVKRWRLQDGRHERNIAKTTLTHRYEGNASKKGTVSVVPLNIV